MGKIRTGFKVCDNRYGFRSAFSFGKEVSYEINTWTYQPHGCGPLAVFERLSDVDNFIGHNITLMGTNETFLCEYEESREKELYDDKGNKFTYILPHGTALATRVKLIKKIKNL